MTTTNEQLANNEASAAPFENGVPLPPARKVAVIVRTFARVNLYRAPGLTEGDAHDEFRDSIHEETWINAEWAADSFSDFEADMRQSVARVKAKLFPRKDSVRDFDTQAERGPPREVS